MLAQFARSLTSTNLVLGLTAIFCISCNSLECSASYDKQSLRSNVERETLRNDVRRIQECIRGSSNFKSWRHFARLVSSLGHLRRSRFVQYTSGRRHHEFKGRLQQNTVPGFNENSKRSSLLSQTETIDLRSRIKLYEQNVIGN
jgi:hypothetical protein